MEGPQFCQNIRSARLLQIASVKRQILKAGKLEGTICLIKMFHFKISLNSQVC